VQPHTTIAAARVITPTRDSTAIDVKVGELVRVRRPADFARWQVDYAAEVLRPVAGATDVVSPGPDGWTFVIVGEGTSDLTLTAEPPPGPGPVPPSPPKFTLIVRATKP
jgi:hypothetical protein